MSASDDAATEEGQTDRERDQGQTQDRERNWKHEGKRLRKQPFLSGGLSVLIAGLGQVYNGQYLRGSALILAALTIMLVAQAVPDLGLEASALGLLVHAVAAYDAYAGARRINAEAETGAT